MFFEALPLRQDFAEAAKCFDAIISLIHEQHPLIQPHFDHILAVFAHVLPTSDPSAPEDKAMITSETRKKLLQLLAVRSPSFACSVRPADVNICFQQLNTQVPDQLAARGLNGYL